MGGLFGGGKKKSSGSETPARQTTADSIETKDGAIYDRRATDQKTATDNIMDPLGGAKKADATLSTDPLDAMMSRQKKSKTIAGAPSAVGFG